MKNFPRLLAMIVLTTLPARAANVIWTNTLGGSWHVAANWSPNFVPGAADKAFITNAGTYTVTLTSATTIPAFDLGGNLGTPTLVLDNGVLLNLTNAATVFSGGNLVASNCFIAGALTIQAGGQMLFAGSATKTIYSLNLTNLGTVVWSGGAIQFGSLPITSITNGGLWQITGNDNFSNGGGSGSLTPVFNNGGIIRKTIGTGQTFFTGWNLVNAPGGLVDVLSGTLMLNGSLTNQFTGSFNATAPGTLNIYSGIWTDAGGIFSGTGTNLFSGTTLYLRTNVPPALKLIGGDVWITGTNTFQNSGSITNLAIDGATLRGTNTVTGTLAFTAGSIPEKLTIAPSGQFNVTNNTVSKLLYGATIINQGTVNLGAGVNTGTTTISNGGLWNITGDYSINYGGGAMAVLTNSGTFRKAAGSSISASSVDANFINLPGAQVETLAGRLVLNFGTASQFGGTFNTTGILELNNGVWTDTGGVAIGSGTNRLAGGTFNFVTNTIPGLLLVGGNVFITGTNTFQNAGAVTNLTLDGATLGGTNTVSGGTLTMNAGSLAGQLTVLADGQLNFGPGASKFLAPLALVNRGTVAMSNSVSIGNTLIANFGLWQVAGDIGLNYGGVGTAAFTNNGTFRKTSGSGTADNTSYKFINQPGALVQVDTGTLLFAATSTNLFGTLRLNGGTLAAHFSGVLNVAGGTLDGAGTVSANYFSGGTISPGQGGAARINFSSGLNLNSNVTLTIDGSGPVPGVSYDTLSVTGAVALASATLQITALPTVPAGTKFTLIDNDGADAVSGTFAGLPENSSITNGAQTFRIHYAAGTGNDVTLVRDGVVTGPQLAMQSYATNAWTFIGSGAIPLTAFTVRASTNLLAWTNIGVVTSSVSGAWTFTDTNAWRYARRFYNTTN